MRINASATDRNDVARRTRRTRRFLAVSAAAVLAMTVSACGGSSDAAGDKTDTIRLGIVPVATWVPVMVAQEKGYFKDHGLTVKITNITQSPSAAIGRQFDLAQATGTDFLQAVNGGLDQVLVSNVAQETDTTKIIVPPNSDIKDLADLKGKRIGVATRASVIAQSLLAELKKDGVKESDVTLQEMPFPTMLDQLKAGKVDAIAPTEPFVGQAVAAGNRPLSNPLLTATHDFTGGKPPMLMFVAASRKWAETHTKDIKAWRDSLDQANKFIADNEDEARAIFQRYTKLPKQVAQNMPLYNYEATPTTAAQLDVWLDVLKGSGTIAQDNKIDTTKLVIK